MRRLDATCDFVEGESGSEFEKGEERGGVGQYLLFAFGELLDELFLDVVFSLLCSPEAFLLLAVMFEC